MTTPTPVLMSWSGGKDSTMALHRLIRDPSVRVVGLLTSVTAGHERISIHGVRRSILQRQVEGLGLPLFEARLPQNCSNDDYEAAFAAALGEARAQTPGLTQVAFGDLFLADVRAYREALLARLGVQGRFPLWGEDTAALARGFVGQGFQAILSCVDTTQLDAGFCGRDYDAAMLDALPDTVDPCGEHGEFHTCVYAGPLWRQPLPLLRGEQLLRDGRFQYCDLLLDEG